MVRVVKEPEERRKEIIDAAEILFMKQGYDNTSVEAVIKEVGIAKGTFYHYFKSKDDLLNEIVNGFTDQMIVMLDKIIEDQNLNAVQKMFAIFDAGKQLMQKHRGVVDYIHEERNELFHHRLEKKNMPVLTDYMEKLIQEGVEEGLFDTKYPREAGLSIMVVSAALGHERPPQDISDEEKLRLAVIILELMERILGAKQGTFSQILNMLEE